MPVEGSSQPEWTVTRLLAWTREHLDRNAVESPRLCAEILLAHAMKCDRIQLYTQHEAIPAEDVLSPFRESVRKVAAGTPLAYLTGTKEFFSLTFEVTPDVLIPRPETEVLVERTIALARAAEPPFKTVLDLGTGSGCIAVSLARHLPDVAVYASDISPEAVAVARRNAQRHNVAERIEFGTGDLFGAWSSLRETSAADGGPPFDVVVCNPPYIGTDIADSLPTNVREFEPPTALFAGPDGLDIIRRLAAETGDWLRPNGYLLLEVAYDQSAAVRGLLEQGGWRGVRVQRDAANHERVLEARHPAHQTQVA